ncbi:MAG: hypothetical protein LBS36_03395 [Oscillospiraceae bacterium]|nr:hypothetical protein [Oscillospiraceae bacterium]
MIYDFDSASQSNETVLSSIEIIEDRSQRKYSSTYYGTVQNKPLEFNLVFGKSIENNSSLTPLTRAEIESVSAWLTSINGYRWLEVQQPDLENIRYKCNITELKLGSVSWNPIVFICKVVCDSQFAYMYPEETVYEVDGEETFTFDNKSSYSGFYHPKLEIAPSVTNRNVSIVNISNNNRETLFTSIPGSVETIYIDGENGIITNSADLNLYDNFNFKFLRLKRGNNIIKISGKCTVKLLCEFPISVGA